MSTRVDVDWARHHTWQETAVRIAQVHHKATPIMATQRMSQVVVTMQLAAGGHW